MSTPNDPQEPLSESHHHVPVEKEKKSGIMKWLLPLLALIALLLIIGAIVAALNDDDDDDNEDVATASETTTNLVSTTAQAAAAAAEENHTLKWEVETSDNVPVDVSYMGENTEFMEETGVPSGWSKEVPMDTDWEVLGANLNAGRQGPGDITCRVYWDNQLVAENTETGDNAVATCDKPNI